MLLLQPGLLPAAERNVLTELKGLGVLVHVTLMDSTVLDARI